MKKKKFSLGMPLVYLLLIVWALTTIYPLIWVVMNSFKDKKQIVSNSFALPFGGLFTLDNYEKAINKFSIFTAYRNSLIISCTVAAVVILFAGLASYALVRYKFRGSNLMNSLVIAAMMFPVFATIIPVFRMESSWGIVNTNNLWLALLSCALPQIAGNLAFAIVVLSGYIKGLPVELEEAVRVMIENLEKQGITGKEDGTDEGVGENTPKAEGNREGEEGKEKAEPSEGKEGEETDSPASCFIVKNALAYIEENYREKLKLSDVADQIYVSQWHLSKLLNKHTGQNFSEILNTIRIEKAKELLKDPSLRIGDIAEEVGFLDVAHFSRVFKKQAGISANEYRNTKLGS